MSIRKIEEFMNLFIFKSNSPKKIRKKEIEEMKKNEKKILPDGFEPQPPNARGLL